jgi:hypothetical protein
VKRICAVLLLTPLVGCTAAQPPVPDRMWPYVDAARVSLEQNQDGLFRSRFVFHEVRCRLDGGLVVIFDQRGFFGSDGLAFAISGVHPAIRAVGRAGTRRLIRTPMRKSERSWASTKSP